MIGNNIKGKKLCAKITSGLCGDFHVGFKKLSSDALNM